MKVFVHARTPSISRVDPSRHTSYSINSDGFRLDIVLVETESLRLHEDTILSSLDLVFKDIKMSRLLKSPVIVDGDSLVVLDGMHRVEALKRLDCKFTCVCLVDYMSPRIKVDRWCRVVSRPIDINEFSSKFGELKVVMEHAGDESSLLLMLEEGNFEFAASGQGVVSAF